MAPTGKIRRIRIRRGRVCRRPGRRRAKRLGPPPDAAIGVHRRGPWGSRRRKPPRPKQKDRNRPLCCQLLPSSHSSSLQNASAVLRLHSLSEAMLFFSLPHFRLIGHFHVVFTSLPRAGSGSRAVCRSLFFRVGGASLRRRKIGYVNTPNNYTYKVGIVSMGLGVLPDFPMIG
jgi:hypothetical protein